MTNSLFWSWFFRFSKNLKIEILSTFEKLKFFAPRKNPAEAEYRPDFSLSGLQCVPPSIYVAYKSNWGGIPSGLFPFGAAGMKAKLAAQNRWKSLVFLQNHSKIKVSRFLRFWNFTHCYLIISTLRWRI